MAAEPEITLTATLQDLTGQDIDNASLSITLCGYGQTLPRIAGTAMIAKTGPMKFVLATGATTDISLWGNDQITPGGTYYAIEVIDDKNNIVQSGIYQFNGAQTIDLSNAPQLNVAPAPPAPFFTMLQPYPDRFVAEAGQTVFALTKSPFAAKVLIVAVGGIVQDPETYSVENANQLILDFATQNGDIVNAIYLA